MKRFMAFALTAAMVSTTFGATALADETTAPEAEVVAADEATDEATDEVADEASAEEETTDEAAPVEEEKEEEAVAEVEETEEETTEAEAPVKEEAPAAAVVAPKADVKKDAVLSNAKVAVNGAAIAPQAYTIDGYTYFKLRDVANALVGTEAGFDVAWDKAARMTVLTTGAEYTATAGTDAAAAAKAVAKFSADAVKVNDAEVVLEAYNIGGYNYYKLRELGEALGFEVTWDKEARMIGINSAVLGEEAPVVDETPAEDAIVDETPAEDEAPVADEATTDEAPVADEAPADDATTDEASADETEAPAEDAAE